LQQAPGKSRRKSNFKLISNQYEIFNLNSPPQCIRVAVELRVGSTVFFSQVHKIGTKYQSQESDVERRDQLLKAIVGENVKSKKYRFRNPWIRSWLKSECEERRKNVGNMNTKNSFSFNVMKLLYHMPGEGTSDGKVIK
jgi:hypothetical protein